VLNREQLGSAGSGAEFLGLSQSKVAQALSATNIYAIGLGDMGVPANAASVGSLSVSNYQKNTDSRSDAFSGAGNILALYDNSSVAGSLSYTGGNGIDYIGLPYDLSGAPVSIGGNLTFNAYEGTNTLAMGNVTAGVTVGGTVQFNGGTGVDRFFLDSGSTVNGSVILFLGEGDNEIFSGPPAGGATVGGNVTVNAGNGNNQIGAFSAAFVVGGNLTFTLGSGNNTGFGGGDIDFFNDFVSVGQTATYRAGSGTNNLVFESPAITNLRLLFSGGPTTLTFNQDYNGILYIDFGTGFGPKVIAGSGAFNGPTTILNYP